MHIASIHVDSALGESKVIERPLWSEIESAIHELNGTDCTLVGLFIAEDEFMQIGGGPGLFVCSARHSNRLWILFDSSKSTGTEEWIIAGQGAHYPSEECTSLELVLQAARYYAELGIPDLDLQWKQF